MLKIRIIDTNRHDFKTGFYNVRKSSTQDETGQSSLKIKVMNGHRQFQ